MNLRANLLALALAASPAAAQIPLDGPTTTYGAGSLELQLVDATQTAAHLRAGGFDFAPGDRLHRRAGNGFVHLGDLTIRTRMGNGEWSEHSSALNRESIVPLAPPDGGLASAELPGFPLRVVRTWSLVRGALALTFTLENRTSQAIEIGSLSIPLAFNNILSGRSLDEAHAASVFYDPYIGLDAGYVQVARLSGEGPVLLVVPTAGTPLEAWRPVLEDSTARGITFEGFQAWMPHSLAHAETDWADAVPWNPPTSRMLAPGESAGYGLRFLIADSLRAIEDRLAADGRPVVVGVPGYVLPTDTPGRFFVRARSTVESWSVEPEGALGIARQGTTPGGWLAFSATGASPGRARLTLRYDDGSRQSVHFKVIAPSEEVVTRMGEFLFDEQWFDDSDDPFGRAPSVISYDYTNRRQVTEDTRAWIAGLGDEGGSGSWLAAAMKQLILPDPQQIRQLERFVDETVWGGLQYAEGPLQYGVRKSLFWWDPDGMPAGTYADSIRYGSWSSWSPEHAATVGRSYNYPHVAALYWTMYRLARQGVVTNHAWTWYLERAHETSEAMVRLAPEYAQFGQMEGTVFLRILEDLQREGWDERAGQLEATMRARAEVWERLGYPFGSEMPWDSTGQEEVYAWTRYFGMDEKAAVTLNAILAYVPLVPHWGYNGSARRYWDFWYAGHPATSRLERQLHHYGSALNAIPLLTEFRDHPTDFHLLRAGHAGMMGALANVTEDGFAPAAFHSFPSTLAIDGYSGDYGPGFFGHAVNTGAYLFDHPEFGVLAFGGVAESDSAGVTLRPTDSARMRVFLAPVGLYLELDAGRFESVRLDASTGAVTVRLDSPGGQMRITTSPGYPAYATDGPTDRGALVIAGPETMLHR